MCVCARALRLPVALSAHVFFLRVGRFKRPLCLGTVDMLALVGINTVLVIAVRASVHEARAKVEAAAANMAMIHAIAANSSIHAEAKVLLAISSTVVAPLKRGQ